MRRFPLSTSVELEVPNPSGLHARPAATFVKAASGFRSDIKVTNVSRGSATVSAKSILGVLQLGVSRGQRIRIDVAGDDEQAAIDALRDLVSSGLGESLEAG